MAIETCLRAGRAQSPGGSLISIPGAVLTDLRAPSESCGFSASIKMRQARPCCSSSCLPASHCRSRFIPDDEFAPLDRPAEWQDRSVVRPRGNGQIRGFAVGLKRHLTPQELRASIRDGSIASLTQWRPVVKDEIIFIPAGTITP